MNECILVAWGIYRSSLAILLLFTPMAPKSDHLARSKFTDLSVIASLTYFVIFETKAIISREKDACAIQ
jgi:antibiotic biosynthesis monooxygenase (ABM) superfamily enzyme